MSIKITIPDGAKELILTFVETDGSAAETPADPVVPVTPSGKKLKVALDAGHGGKDPGAVNQGQDASWAGDDIREKEGTLAIAQAVQVGMEMLGWEVLMTRSDDTYIGLGKRAEMANEWGADVFISIHLNSAESDQATGIETLRYPTTNPITIALAANLQERMVAELGLRNRGVKERNDLTVLKKTKMPAALCELGFISNKAVTEGLYDKDFIAKAAKAIIQGVEMTFNE